MLIDESPVDLPKAIKNPTEVRGMKSANVSKYCPSVSLSLVKVKTYFLATSNARLLATCTEPSKSSYSIKLYCYYGNFLC